MSNTNTNDILPYLYDKKVFLDSYLDKINKKGYTKLETQFVVGQIDIINQILNNISFKSLYELLSNCSNRRLEKIISGEELISEVLLCPDDYKLVIDLDDLSKSDTKNSLIFIDIRDKYCYLKHKDYCEDGLNYINGKWQLLK